MNNHFDVCGKCRFYTDNPKKDKYVFEGFCDNKTYRTRFKINSDSSSCDRGESSIDLNDSKVPDKIPIRGEYND